jgi:hypothetical protein
MMFGIGDVFKANLLIGTLFWGESLAKVVGKYKQVHNQQFALTSKYKCAPICFGYCP